MDKQTIPIQKFWNVKKQSDKVGEVYINNQICHFAYKGYSDSSESIRKDIEALGDIDTLNVYINSPGGDVFEGMAIHNYLKRKGKTCKVIGYIDGLCASIATIIVSACDEVRICKGGMYMIHRASTFAWGNTDTLRASLERLEKIDNEMINIYLKQCKGKCDEKTLHNLIKGTDNDGTWFTAQEAIEYGFCDTIEDFEEKATACWSVEDLDPNAPEAVFKLAKNQQNSISSEEDRRYLENLRHFMKLERITE